MIMSQPRELEAQVLQMVIGPLKCQVLFFLLPSLDFPMTSSLLLYM